MYLLITGDQIETYMTLDALMVNAQTFCTQYIWDFLRHKLPLDAAAIEGQLDMRAVDLIALTNIPLPYQKWLDEVYAHVRSNEQEEEIRSLREEAIKLFTYHLDAVYRGDEPEISIEEVKQKAMYLWRIYRNRLGPNYRP